MEYYKRMDPKGESGGWGWWWLWDELRDWYQHIYTNMYKINN